MSRAVRNPKPLRPALLGAALMSLSACATLALGDRVSDQQLTAALTEFREEARGEVALYELELEPVRAPESSTQEIEIREGGPHPGQWLNEALDTGLADSICGESDECEASLSMTVVSFSKPYRAREGVFVDARSQSVTDTGYGTVRTTRFSRLTIAEGQGGWRVIAKTPLWETSG
ncbi:MAG: hypothetical protein ACR2QM_05890 [Longimicrobiales bacterium]